MPPFTGLQFRASLTLTLSLTFQHRAGVTILRLMASQRAVFLLNSRLGLIHCGFPLRKHPFSRSYGVILPSSLTRVLSHTLGFSLAYLCRFAVQAPFISLEAFSWQRGNQRLRSIRSFPSQLSLYDKRICLLISLTAWTCTTNRTLLLSFCVPPLLKR